ncbi:conserved exported hypothetical protein [Hyella patelloides LEGE 07179]|uniref:Glutathione S-transferase n=1 Tax=Hyella patelloides LEGE 07179 TaxID=945734 RepID=A0A563W116_9CYAN|nr:glutathione S-transferase [Hyella patelloides]VEP17327.1 conserved exported hypothetical protein [Hyella patelloides LEGE 07179]
MKLTTVCLLFSFTFYCRSAQALPPPEDTPEEILRTEIILNGRSPIDNQPLTASEYAKIQERIAQSKFSTPIDPKIRELIFLLRLRKFLRTVTPF